MVCRSKPQNPHSDNGKQNKVSHLGGDTEEYSLFQLEGKKSPKPMEVTLTVDGHEMTMEVDTGAAWSVISKSTYQKIWHTRPLKPSLINLRTYTGEAVTVFGNSRSGSCIQRPGQQASLARCRWKWSHLAGKRLVSLHQIGLECNQPCTQQPHRFSASSTQEGV